MNTSLLTDENFVQKMKEKLDQWKKEGEEFSDVRVAWDWIKYNVRLLTINYSKEVANTKRGREEKLLRKLQIAQAQFQQTPCEEVEKILDECKADLENFYEEKANGLIVRARTRWHECGEKNTKYFLCLEKRNYTRKHIRKLCLSGVITKNYKKILDSASEYYKNLYSSKLKVDQSDSLHHFLGNSDIPRLSQEERLRATCCKDHLYLCKIEKKNRFSKNLSGRRFLRKCFKTVTLRLFRFLFSSPDRLLYFARERAKFGPEIALFAKAGKPKYSAWLEKLTHFIKI